uniref:TRAF3-interacting protein 1 n=2 Tax=Dendroctonus ponderosae TaxID=77166 RepID=A0AAR5P1Y3_DENPD
MSDVSAENVAKTQKYLGKYVKKPILSEKLLKKPPFRFLHDIIKCVIKETGFLSGLFSDDELNSEKVKEKEAKVAFLTKLIEAVKAVSKVDLKVRPSKVVAGLEPTETNVLLQTIGKCIEKKIDTKSYVAKLQSGEILPKDRRRTQKETSKKTSSKDSSSRKPRESSVSRTKKSSTVTETPKEQSSRSSTRKSAKSKNKEKTEEAPLKKNSTQNDHDIVQTIAEDEQVQQIPEEPPKEIVAETQPQPIEAKEEQPDKAQEVVKPEEDMMTNFSNARQSSAGLIRPKSARPKSGERPNKPKDDLIGDDADSVPIVSMGKLSSPGAPRLRPESALPASEPMAMGDIKVIVENFDSGMGDEEDTVVIQNDPDIIEDNEIQTDLLNISGDNKGQLVEQILEQIQGQEGVRKKVEIDWEQDGLRGKDATTKEVTRLRALIQSLTKAANPLGKLMNYLHEDLEAMHNELQMWTNTKKQLYVEIEKEKKSAVEFTKPLLDKLDHLKQEIGKQEREIREARSTILKNEQRIAELLERK